MEGIPPETERKTLWFMRPLQTADRWISSLDGALNGPFLPGFRALMPSQFVG